MGLIKQLPDDIAIKIAAGEVVERPASAVKELVENSLDAGATQISIHIKDGGKTLIEIIDNGSGMDRDDAQAAFLRHGTSKIREVEDLAHVTTLGFRGEALAAIGASAMVELITTRQSDPEGTHVIMAYGEKQSVKPHAPLPGTTLRITNLFEALPARQKFLKSDVTEWKACLEIITRQLLANPTVGFLVKHNDRTIFDVPAEQTFTERVAAVWKMDPSALITVHSEIPHSQLQGVIAKPEAAYENKSRQFFAVNGHPVNDKMVMRAVKEAFGSLLPPQMQPVYALNLVIHPGMVDVNIHPRKDEVRFINSQEVFRFVLTSVSQSLDGVDVSFAKPAFTSASEASSFNQAPTPVSNLWAQPSVASTPSFGSKSYTPSSFTTAVVKSAPTGAYMPQSVFEVETAQGEPESFSTLTVANCFVMTTHNGSLLLIDQHAAHERILYNQLWEQEKGKSAANQTLLIPVPLYFDEATAALLVEQREAFESLGFAFVDGADGLELTQIPHMLKKVTPETFIRTVLETLGDRTEPELTTIKHRLFATMACKAAVKAGDVLDESEKQALIRDLLTLPNIFTCPHGRPTHITVSAGELEKLFKRTGF